MCVGIILSLHRVDVVQLLLADLRQQTDPPREVIVVVQSGSEDEVRRCEDTLTRMFGDLPIRIAANPLPGPSAARNVILSEATTGVAVFMDDDARMPKDAVEHVAGAFEHFPDADVITFKARWTGAAGGERVYPSSPGVRRTLRSVTSVAAIEIAVSCPRIAALGVRFDERFGPGTRYSTGEEFIFASDVIRSGGVLRFVPEVISEHPARTAGYRLDRAAMLGKGAIFRRVFGRLGLVAALFLAARKAVSRELECSALQALASATAGWREFGRLSACERRTSAGPTSEAGSPRR
jgi:glycosyltransferase involved in cell wall biosynthesis